MSRPLSDNEVDDGESHPLGGGYQDTTEIDWADPWQYTGSVLN